MVEKEPNIEKQNLFSEHEAYWQDRLSKLEKQIHEVRNNTANTRHNFFFSYSKI
jgi:hypothetical protein